MPNNIYPEFTWWQGIVENRNDPDKMGRYQVRIFGYHSRNKVKLPTADLPWAIPMQPVTSAAISGVGSSPTGIVEGSAVVGFFADGPDGQIPVIMGSFGAMTMLPSNDSGPIKFDRSTVGFYDESETFPRNKSKPFEKAVLEDVETDNPNFVKGGDEEETITTKLKDVKDQGYNSLDEPDSSRLARGSKWAEQHFSLKSKRANRIGKQDGLNDEQIDAEYKGIPKATAPTSTIYKTEEASLTHPGMTATPKPKYTEEYWEEPLPQGVAESVSQYPYNHVRETESGHVFEVDDTPGAERIHQYHKSGTYEEIIADGSRSVKIVGKDYEIVVSDKNILIQGDWNITVDGDYNLNVLGNKYEDVNGHLFTAVRGNAVTKIQGNETREIMTDYSQLIVGNKWETIQNNQGTGQTVLRVQGLYTRSISEEMALYKFGKVSEVQGDYKVIVSPAVGLHPRKGPPGPTGAPLGRPEIPGITNYGSFKVKTIGDIEFGTSKLPIGTTFPTISMQSAYITSTALFGDIESVGIIPQPMMAPGMPMGKWTQVDTVGITELVFAGKIARLNLSGPIVDYSSTSIMQAASARITQMSGSITRNAGMIKDNGGGMISMNAGIIKLN